MIKNENEFDWKLADLPSDQEVEFYRENGYLKFGRIFTENEIDDLRDHVDEMIANLPHGKRPEQMDVPHFEDPFLFKYLTHSRVLDVIERFIGPDIVLWSSHFISKRAKDGLAVPWHQDGVYWGDRLRPMNVITMWLAVDESTIENGCMKVIFGTNRDRQLRYNPVDREKNLFNSEVVEDDLDRSLAVDLELKIGECHFHDAFALHASNPNHSEKRRCGYTMRYMPADVEHHYNPNWNRPHRVYLVRGRDRTNGFNDYEPLPNF